MSTKKRLLKNLWIPAMGVAIAFALVALSYTPTNTAEAAGNSGCEGDVKIEGDSGRIVTLRGTEIAFVCIKAGRGIFTFEAGDPGDGCYVLDWQMDNKGCYRAVTVSGGGTGRDCKAISHFSATFQQCFHEDPK